MNGPPQYFNETVNHSTDGTRQTMYGLTSVVKMTRHDIDTPTTDPIGQAQADGELANHTLSSIRIGGKPGANKRVRFGDEEEMGDTFALGGETRTICGA